LHHPLHLIELPELLIQNPKPSDLPVVQRIVDGLSQYLMPVKRNPPFLFRWVAYTTPA
jgi:hypothetical protein